MRRALVRQLPLATPLTRGRRRPVEPNSGQSAIVRTPQARALSLITHAQSSGSSIRRNSRTPAKIDERPAQPRVSCPLDDDDARPGHTHTHTHTYRTPSPTSLYECCTLSAAQVEPISSHNLLRLECASPTKRSACAQNSFPPEVMSVRTRHRQTNAAESTCRTSRCDLVAAPPS
jgi:hypothetical protein